MEKKSLGYTPTAQFDPTANYCTIDVGRKVLGVVDAGLVRGGGTAVPGRMCIENAVAYALGFEFNDQPKCVHPTVRSLKIMLNDDEAWSSNQARAQGMRKIAVAQIGSDKINERQFLHALIERAEALLPPISLDYAAVRASIDRVRATLDADEAAGRPFLGATISAQASPTYRNLLTRAKEVARITSDMRTLNSYVSHVLSTFVYETRAATDHRNDAGLALCCEIVFQALTVVGAPGPALWADMERQGLTAA